MATSASLERIVLYVALGAAWLLVAGAGLETFLLKDSRASTVSKSAMRGFSYLLICLERV